MTRRAAILLMGLAGLALGLAPAACGGSPRWVWNASESAPPGLYRLEASPTLSVGEWVAVAPPDEVAADLAARGALPAGALLIKQVAALAPSRVCRFAAVVSVDGAPVAWAKVVDGQGRSLPAWGGCRDLRPSEIFLLNVPPDSLDSRYFGTLPREAVVGRVERVLPWRAPPHGR